MSALATLLDSYRSASVTERKKGTYFEELIVAYLRNEATYRDLYDQVWTYADWAREQGLDGRDKFGNYENRKIPPLPRHLIRMCHRA